MKKYIVHFVVLVALVIGLGVTSANTTHAASAADITINSITGSGGSVNIAGLVESGIVSCGSSGESGYICNCCDPADYLGPGERETCNLNQTLNYTITGPTNRSGSVALSITNSPNGCSTSCTGEHNEICSQDAPFTVSESGLLPGNYDLEITASDCEGVRYEYSSFTVPNQCTFDAGLTVDGGTVANISVGDTVTFGTNVTNQSNCSTGWSHRVDETNNGSIDHTQGGSATSRTFTSSPFNSPGTYTASGVIFNTVAWSSDDTNNVTINVSNAPLIIDGECNQASAKEYSSSNTTLVQPQCQQGNHQPVSGAVGGNAPATWNCLGVNGGLSVSCEATVTPDPPQGGACGTGARTYASSDQYWDGTYLGLGTPALCNPTSGNPSPTPAFPAQGATVNWNCGTTSCSATRQAPSTPSWVYNGRVSLSARNRLDAPGYPNQPAMTNSVSNTYLRAKVEPASDAARLTLRGEFGHSTSYTLWCYSHSKDMTYAGTGMNSYTNLVSQGQGYHSSNATYPQWGGIPFFYHACPSSNNCTQKTWSYSGSGTTYTGEYYFDHASPSVRNVSADTEFVLLCRNQSSDSDPLDATSRVFAQLVGDVRVISQDSNGTPVPTTWTLSGPELKQMNSASADATVDAWLGASGAGTYTLTPATLGGYGTPVVTYTTDANATPVTGASAVLSRTSAPVTFTVTYPEEVCDFVAVARVNGQTGNVGVGVGVPINVSLTAEGISGPCGVDDWRHLIDMDYENFVTGYGVSSEFNSGWITDEMILESYTYPAVGSHQVRGMSRNRDDSSAVLSKQSNIVNVTVGNQSANIDAIPNPCSIGAGEYACSTNISWDTTNVGDSVVVTTGSNSQWAGSGDGVTHGPEASGNIVTESGTTFSVYAADSNGDPIGGVIDSATVTVVGQPLPECNDNVDNDGDGKIDYDGKSGTDPDPGCNNNPNDNDERDAGNPQCDDGIDNDQDGFIDHQESDNRPVGAQPDPGCDSPTDDDELNTNTECSDGFDNDGDGFTDFSGGDPECDNGLDDREAGEPTFEEF